ncbi:MAG: hypothetical protein KDK36_03370 [Leptospiraceae bacterium]|nr:hypothetical protein [Leptospiraceae bacterium]
MKILNLILIFSVLVNSIILESANLGLTSLKSSIICTCNHNSKKEIHSKKNKSVLLKSDLEKIGLGLKSKKLFPDCHSANSGEKHICSCKKTNSNLKNFLFQKQISLFNSIFIAKLHFIKLFNISEIITKLSPYNHFKLIKPPKN